MIQKSTFLYKQHVFFITIFSSPFFNLNDKNETSIHIKFMSRKSKYSFVAPYGAKERKRQIEFL